LGPVDYVACFGATPWLQYTNEAPADQLRFALSEVMNFTASLLVDVTKAGPLYYLSTGAHELKTNCHATDYVTQQQLNGTGMTLNDALNAFTQTTRGALFANGRMPVVWGGAFAV
jgi:hexosaminidase